MATDVGLLPVQFVVAERVIADPVIADEPPAHPLADQSMDDEQVAAATAPIAAFDFPGAPAAQIAPPRATEERVETPEQAAERQKLINELVGHGEPARRRPWRRALS